MDTPGYPDFIGEVKSAIRVSEGAVIVVCASSGVEVGTEQVWAYCNANDLPRIAYVNRMDRENADFTKVVDQIQSKFGRKCLPIQLPIGEHTTFQGIIDLLKMKSYTGAASKEGEIPAELLDEAKSLREKLVESVAETEDALLEKFLGGEELSQEELTKALTKAVAAGKLTPIMAGSGLQNIGVLPLMDAIVNYLPASQRTIRLILSETIINRRK